MSDWLGKMLGKVRIDSLLARGGIAEVYLGEHTTLQREVAVKILRNQYEEDPDLLERFQREARVVAKLRHPNIVQVFDFDTIENHPYLVMEYIPGLSLSRYLHVLHGKNGRLELPVINRILSRVASALHYAHESGVIHRDVKPGNILLTSRSGKVIAGKPLPGDFEPILTDFGLVRFLNSSRQTTAGIIAGTPAYMSPEQARGEATDERTDIYSLGIVLYELLTGHVPFDGETTTSIILKQVTEPPPPVPDLSYELQYVLDRALAKKPADRFQSPVDFADAFAMGMEDMTDSVTLIDAEPPSKTHITKVGYREKKRRKWVPALLLGMLVTLTGGFLLLQNTFNTPGTPTIQLEPPTPSLAILETDTPQAISLPPIGVLHFQDGIAVLDAATLTTVDMPPPPQGSHYEVWLVNSEERRSLGILLPDGNGAGALASSFVEGNNLLAAYNQVEVSVELNSDTDPAPSGSIAYSFTLPSKGLEYVRNIIVAYPETPDNISLLQGLRSEINLIGEAARNIQKAHENGNRAGMRQNAEDILNLIAGKESENYKDWDKNSRITNPGKGFGLLLNKKTAGYLQLVFSQADYAAVSPEATQAMTENGREVKTCARNITHWITQLRGLALTILSASSETDLSQPVRDTVILADQLLTGLDADGDQIIAPTEGECGLNVAYESAYSMADMPLLPYAPSPATETPIATSVSSGNELNGPTNTPVSNKPTQKPHPTQRPENTKKPKNNSRP